MVKVEFMGPIGLPTREFDVKNLSELKDALHAIPEVKKWLDISAIAVNNTIVNTLDFELADGDRVVVLPPVCGG